MTDSENNATVAASADAGRKERRFGKSRKPSTRMAGHFAARLEEAQSRIQPTEQNAVFNPTTEQKAAQSVVFNPTTEFDTPLTSTTDGSETTETESTVSAVPPPPPKASSALRKRPNAKAVDDGTVPTYVAGVQIRDELAERKGSFCGWKDDPEAVEVVDRLGRGERFDEADFSGVDFSGADLNGISFKDAVLSDANFAGADLRGADLSGADLRGVNLESANLEGANLEGALLDGAYLKNAIIVKVRLAAKALNELEKMQQLQLMAENGQVDLRKVNLKYLDLRRLDLRGVDLTGIDLSGICLVGVNLSGCKIDPMYLDASYAFRSAPNRRLSIRGNSLAGADFTTATFIRAKQEEKELLRQKRMNYERQEEENARIQENENALKQENETQEVKVKEETLSFLAERRKEAEVIQAQIEQVQQEDKQERKIPVMKHRPRAKGELPASKYDFPVLYKTDEETDAKTETPQPSDIAVMTQQVTYHVKETIKKIIPRRSRVCKQRQRT